MQQLSRNKVGRMAVGTLCSIQGNNEWSKGKELSEQKEN